jgi:hypothetical protein
MTRDARSPAQYVDALRRSLARHRAGEITFREHLDHTARIWVNVMAHGLLEEVHAEMTKGRSD